MAKCHKIKAKITMIMVIFKLFMDIVKIGWVRVIYDGSGNFQVFSGFLWPKLRVPHCNLKFGLCTLLAKSWAANGQLLGTKDGVYYFSVRLRNS